VAGIRKRHDAACALKGKRAYLRQAASSSSAPQQPAAAARKRASGVAPGVGQIVFSGNWHYSPDLKRNRVICRSDFLFEKKGERLWIQRAFVLSGIEWIYQIGRVWIDGNV